MKTKTPVLEVTLLRECRPDFSLPLKLPDAPTPNSLLPIPLVPLPLISVLQRNILKNKKIYLNKLTALKL
jgi:hypothetical protein